MFEKASRLKIRFSTSKGFVSTEDLWDLSLQSLNTVAKDINKKLKLAEEEDFLNEAKKADTELKLSFDIVLHILNIKKTEKEAKELASVKAEKKEKLLSILAKKQDAGLEQLSEEQLIQQIKDL